MLKVRRLNLDNSWQITWGDTSILLDPWLIGSEVDGFSWFNEQWHATSPVPISDLDKYDGIVVSQCYSDHCHEQTLEALKRVPLIGTHKTVDRLKKGFPQASVQTIPDILKGQWLQFGEVRLACLDPNRKMDPIYYGLIIRKNKQAILYFPHGFYLSKQQIEALQSFEIELLITSFSFFKLPFFMGGAVNPGKENAFELIKTLQPKKVVHTHDENKHAKGLVKKIATTEFPDFKSLEKELAGRFIFLGKEYEPINL